MRSNLRSRPALILLTGALLAMPGCAWVTLTPEAEGVRVVSSTQEVAGCRNLGGIRAQTRARIGFIARSEEKISQELEALARNNAAEMGADTLVADGPPSAEGRQRFEAYRCR